MPDQPKGWNQAIIEATDTEIASLPREITQALVDDIFMRRGYTYESRVWSGRETSSQFLRAYVAHPSPTNPLHGTDMSEQDERSLTRKYRLALEAHNGTFQLERWREVILSGDPEAIDALPQEAVRSLLTDIEAHVPNIADLIEHGHESRLYEALQPYIALHHPSPTANQADIYDLIDGYRTACWFAIGDDRARPPGWREVILSGDPEAIDALPQEAVRSLKEDFQMKTLFATGSADERLQEYLQSHHPNVTSDAESDFYAGYARILDAELTSIQQTADAQAHAEWMAGDPDVLGQKAEDAFMRDHPEEYSDDAEITGEGIPTIVHQTDWSISSDGYEVKVMVGKLDNRFLSGYQRSQGGGEPVEVWDWDNRHETPPPALKGAYALLDRDRDENVQAEVTDQPKYRILPYDTERSSVKEGGNLSPLFRIEALRDIPLHGVKAGDYGGLIEHEGNLSQNGSAWISDNAQVCDDARVEDDALMRGSAIATKSARITGSSIVEGHSYLSGKSTVGGNAYVRDVTMFDDATLGGSIRIMIDRTFQSGEHYSRNEDIPFDFAKATGKEAEYFQNLDKAIDLDPKIGAYFQTLGYQTNESKHDALRELWAGAERGAGRPAVIQMAKLVGGRFEGGEYHQRNAGSIFQQVISEAQFGAHAEALSEFRVPDSMISSGAPDYDPRSGAAMYPVVLKAVAAFGDGPDKQTVFQPAIIYEADPSSTALIPLPGRLETLPASFKDRFDALHHAMHVTQVYAGVTNDRPSPNDHLGATGKLDQLPVLFQTSRNDTRPQYPLTMRDFTFLVPNAETEKSGSYEGYVTLTMRSDMNELDTYDISAAIKQAASPKPSVYEARTRATDVHSHGPSVSHMLQLDIKYQKEQLVRMQQSLLSSGLDVQAIDRIEQKINDLNPSNVAIEELVSNNIITKPDGSIEVPAAFRFRHSEGQSYLPGALHVSDGVVRSSTVMHLDTAPGKFGTFTEAGAALAAAESFLHDRSAAPAPAAAEQTAARAPTSGAGPTI